MIRSRRVGTLTSGITLVIFGVIFLLKSVMPSIDIFFIMSLWPLILVSVGIEVIVSYLINKEEKIYYDFGAIILIIILAFFAMGMGGAEFIINHLPEFRGAI